MYVYFFSGHMLLQNALQMYHEQWLRCRGGVSWKNLASPVMINHLPQFAVEFENAGISRIRGFIQSHATVSLLLNSSNANVSQMKPV